MDLHLFVGWQEGHCDHPWVDKLKSGPEKEKKKKKRQGGGRSYLMGLPAVCRTLQFILQSAGKLLNSTSKILNSNSAL